MEYCDAGDLNQFLNIQQQLGKCLPEDKIWKYFIQMSLGLAHIHARKILHRDIKTMNMFMTKDDKIKIGDLGVAKVLFQTQFAKTFVGTPYYLSPEICEEKPYNEKSDIWALGCILYELCTYKHPFNATNQAALILKILKGKYDPIPKEYSAELKKMIELILQKNHFKRPTVIEILTNKGIIYIFKHFHEVIITKAKELKMYELISTDSCINSLTNFFVKEEKNSINNSNSNYNGNNTNINAKNEKIDSNCLIVLKKRESKTATVVNLELNNNIDNENKEKVRSIILLIINFQRIERN